MDALNDRATPIIEDIETSDGCFYVDFEVLAISGSAIIQNPRTLSISI